MKTTLRLLARPVTLLSALLAFTVSSAVAAPETYSVNFTTPWKTGQTYSINATGAQSATTSVVMGGQQPQEQAQKSGAQLEADGKALEVHPNGGLRKAQFTVRSFRSSKGDAPAAETLPKGAVIVAEKSGEELTFTVNGKAATPDQTTLLKMVIALDSADSNDQLVFGSDKPLAIGESWRPDPARVKNELGKDLGEVAKAETVMRLDGVTGSGDGQVAQVSGTILFDGLQPPMPPGFTVKSGKFEAKLTGKIPAVRVKSTRNETLDGTGRFVSTATLPNGQSVSLTILIESKQNVTLTFP